MQFRQLALRLFLGIGLGLVHLEPTSAQELWSPHEVGIWDGGCIEAYNASLGKYNSHSEFLVSNVDRAQREILKGGKNTGMSLSTWLTEMSRAVEELRKHRENKIQYEKEEHAKLQGCLSQIDKYRPTKQKKQPMLMSASKKEKGRPLPNKPGYFTHFIKAKSYYPSSINIKKIFGGAYSQGSRKPSSVGASWIGSKSVPSSRSKGSRSSSSGCHHKPGTSETHCGSD
jgi:hypothetical protein